MLQSLCVFTDTCRVERNSSCVAAKQRKSSSDGPSRTKSCGYSSRSMDLEAGDQDWATDWKIRLSNPGRGKRFFFSPKTPDHVWGPPILLISGSQCSFPVVKWPGPDVGHSPPPSAQVKNKWSYTYTPPICLFLAQTVTNLHSLPLT